jgi:DNA-binding CsgD family transcriptional regulator
VESVRYGETINGAIALLRLATINAERKNYAVALSQLQIVDNLLKKRDSNAGPLRPDHALKQRIDLYALWAAIYEKRGNAALALAYRKKYDELKEMLNSKNDALAVERIKIKWETDKEQQKIKQLNIAASAEKIKRNALLGVLLLLIVISALIYNRQKLVIKRDKVILEKQEVALQLGISRAEEERKNARLALMDYTDQLRIKNDIIENFKTELDNMQRRTDPLYQYRVSQLEDMMNAHIMTDKAWHEFKTLFEKVHPSFFALLNARFPDNTEADMRLLALIRLKLNNREMAGMLGITVEGVKKAKQRLRKKTGLPEEDSLEALIAES